MSYISLGIQVLGRARRGQTNPLHRRRRLYAQRALLASTPSTRAASRTRAAKARDLASFSVRTLTCRRFFPVPSSRCAGSPSEPPLQNSTPTWCVNAPMQQTRSVPAYQSFSHFRRTRRSGAAFRTTACRTFSIVSRFGTASPFARPMVFRGIVSQPIMALSGIMLRRTDTSRGLDANFPSMLPAFDASSRSAHTRRLSNLPPRCRRRFVLNFAVKSAIRTEYYEPSVETATFQSLNWITD